MSGRPFPTRYPEDRARAATIRSKLMLEVASELVARDDFDPKQVRVSFRKQGASSWEMSAFGSDALSAAHEVASGATDFAIVNPAAVIGKAVRGEDPFTSPIPLRAIATVPSYDQLGLAITNSLEVSSLSQIATERPSLRVSLRGDRPDHSVHVYTADVLGAAGFSLGDIERWGGTVTYHTGIPHQEPRASAIREGSVDLVIDEGIYNWVDLAVESDMTFVSLHEAELSRLESLGYRRSVIAASDYRSLAADVTTLDFSGFLVYTRADVADELVTAFCESLVARRERIPWQAGPGLPLERMVTDEPDAPVPIPLHPAAERYWRLVGLIP